MKFAKYLAKRHLDLPEYAPYFIDYKGMKKLIKQLAADSTADNGEESRYERLQHNRSTFFFQLERELEKASLFYNQKQADLSSRIDALNQKRVIFCSGALGEVQRDSIAYISLHEGLLRFRRDLQQLEQFVELNATGFSKVLKKWDKQSRSNTKELYLTCAIDVQPMFNREELVRLSDISSTCLMQIEQLSNDPNADFEPAGTPHGSGARAQNNSLQQFSSQMQLPLYPVRLDDASQDLFQEFMNFAKSYVAADPVKNREMHVWLLELTQAGSAGGRPAASTDSTASTASTTTSEMHMPKPSAHAHNPLPLIEDDHNHVNANANTTTNTDSNVNDSIVASTELAQDRIVKAFNPPFPAVQQNSVTKLLLRAISTLASDDAIMALWNTGLVDVTVTDEVAQRTVLHLCASYNALSKDAVLEKSQGQCAPVEITRAAVFKAALQTSIDVNAVDAYGRTVLHCAAIHNRRDFLHDLANNAKTPIEVNRKDADNLTALHYAIFRGYLGFVEDLLEMGALTSGIDTASNYIPLNFACQRGAYNAAVLLLRMRGNDPMVADAEGLFPLHIVARAGFASFVPLLVQAGANVDLKDKLNGWTPLMYAASEGNSKVVAALLEAHASHLIVDEKGRSALFYAAWEGHPSCLRQLSAAFGPGAKDISLLVPPGSHPPVDNVDSSVFEEFSLDKGASLVEIPALFLPPPIMPLKRYGHNFLDSKRIILQIHNVAIHFNEEHRELSAGRLAITSSSTRDSIPRNLSWPVAPSETTQTFEIDRLDKFSLVFEVLPTFGTRMLGKAIAPPSAFNEEDEDASSGYEVEIVLLNPVMKAIGSLKFSYVVVKPYPGRVLDIQKYDTYWKTTTKPDSSLSVVISSSLNGLYKQLGVSVTRDMVPVILPLQIEIKKGSGILVPVALFTVDQLSALLDEPVRLLKDELACGSRCNVHIQFPTPCEARHMGARWPSMNEYVDSVLCVVFDAARAANSTQPLVFSACHPEICAMLNWKQPNFPVLFCAPAMRADGRYASANRIEISNTPLGEMEVCKSLREACNYAFTNNIMGIVAPAEILALVPAVIPSVRSMGLVLVAERFKNIEAVPEGVDGMLFGDSLEFPNSDF